MTAPAELFAQAHPAFLETLRACSDAVVVAALADQWRTDQRPWAREQLLRYLEHPLDRPGHHALVKRLFKEFERRADHEVVGAFMVAFDNSIRRRVRIVSRFRRTALGTTLVTADGVSTPRNSIICRMVIYTDKRTGQTARKVLPNQLVWGRDPRLFSIATRQYLRRRAWRHFRRLAYRDPSVYTAELTRACMRYRDEDFGSPLALFDCWALINAFFVKHPGLKRRGHVDVPPGALALAPLRPELWQSPEAFEHLLILLAQARAKPVRSIARQLLTAHQTARLSHIDPATLVALLEHEDEEVQAFAAGLLNTATTLHELPLATWFALLAIRNQTVLPLIIEAMKKSVNADQISAADAVALACSEVPAVARLGLELMQSGKGGRTEWLQLANARCNAVGGALAVFAIGSLDRSEPRISADEVLFFLDSLNEGVRHAAWEWVRAEGKMLGGAGFLARLAETPWPALRAELVRLLESRAKRSATEAGALEMLWSSVLLSASRGSRLKPAALMQLADEMAASPERADQLLAVMGVALRSVRATERRAALAALARLLAARPELHPAVAAHFPELDPGPAEATR